MQDRRSMRESTESNRTLAVDSLPGESHYECRYYNLSGFVTCSARLPHKRINFTIYALH